MRNYRVKPAVLKALKINKMNIDEHQKPSQTIFTCRYCTVIRTMIYARTDSDHHFIWKSPLPPYTCTTTIPILHMTMLLYTNNTSNKTTTSPSAIWGRVNTLIVGNRGNGLTFRQKCIKCCVHFGMLLHSCKIHVVSRNNKKRFNIRIEMFEVFLDSVSISSKIMFSKPP